MTLYINRNSNSIIKFKYFSVLAIISTFGALVSGCSSSNPNMSQTPEDLTVEQMVRPSVKVSERTDMVVMQGTDSATGAKTSMTSVSNRTNDLGEKVPHYGSLTGGTGSVDVATSSTGDGEDYVDKCDVYWKLNWIRKDLLAGRAPYNLSEVIKKTRQELNQTRPDGNLDLASEALDHLEKGLVHLAADQDIQAAHIPRASIPWSSGAVGMQRYIDSVIPGAKSQSGSFIRRGSSGFIDDDSLASPTSATLHLPLDWHQQRAIDVLESYAAVQHASPESLMRNEFRIAIQKTNRLRDNLHLERRKENNDGDATEVGAGISERYNIGTSRSGTSSLTGHGIVVQGLSSSGSPADPFESNVPPSKRTP